MENYAQPAATSFAQAYPEKSMRIIVSSSAGGGSDLIARLLAQKLTGSFGHSLWTIASVHPSVPAKNLRELIALAKIWPDEISYGASRQGAIVHLANARFLHMAVVRMVLVPYKGGMPEQRQEQVRAAIAIWRGVVKEASIKIQ